MARLILLEDEAIFREECCDYLRAVGHRVDEAGTLAEFRAKLESADYDVAVLDRMLPDGDSLDLLDEAEALAGTIGIVMLSSKSAVADKVDGLSRGVDYYLAKPVDLEELAAVIAVQQRRREVAAEAAKGRWIVDASNWSLKPPLVADGAGLKLSAQDVIVLRTIADGGGEPVTRRRLVTALGQDYLEYDQRRLDTQMRRLRRKVSEQYGVDLPVKTIHGVGYVFAGDVEIR